MDYQLLIVRGRSASQTVKLAEGVTTVGRHDECQLRIKSSQVSRRHCELFEKKGLLLVKDLGSSNGTYVNGKRVEEQRVLEPGDELTIGPVSLRVAKAGEAAPAGRATASVKPGDTAIVEPIVGATADEEFEIEFDDEPEETVPELSLDEEKPALEAQKPAKAAPEPKPKPEPKPAEEGLADEAIADFLLDIKLDEDD